MSFDMLHCMYRRLQAAPLVGGKSHSVKAPSVSYRFWGLGSIFDTQDRVSERSKSLTLVPCRLTLRTCEAETAVTEL